MPNTIHTMPFSPENIHPVSGDGLVFREDGEAVLHGLGNKEAVKGVPVDEW